MKEYLLLFWNASGDQRYEMDPDKMREGMEAWQHWIGHIAMQNKLISTKPIQWESVLIGNKWRKDNPVIKGEPMVTGYLICKSDIMKEVIDWSETCPILSYPGGYTEIREIAPFDL
jgi:hypothetical protein